MSPARRLMVLGDYEVRKCPRRFVIENPWIVEAHEMYTETDGKLGASADEYPPHVGECMRVISAAQADARRRESGDA